MSLPQQKEINDETVQPEPALESAPQAATPSKRKKLPRAKRLSVQVSYQILALCESALLLVSYLSAHIIWTSNPLADPAQLSIPLILFVAVPLLSSTALGLYHSRQRNEYSDALARLFIAFLISSFVLATLFYFIATEHNAAPPVVLTGLLIGFFLCGGLRYGYHHLSEGSFLKRRVLVMGSGAKACFIEERLRRDVDRRGFKVIGYAVISGDEPVVDESKRVYLAADQFEQYVQANRIEEIVIAPDQRRGTLPMEALYRCRISGVKVSDIATFIEQECFKIPLKLFDPSWVIYGTGFQNTHFLVRLAKRGFDIAVSLALLAIIWPVMLMTALLIMVESGPTAPILYSQKRVGRGGIPFWIYKFRSMQVNAEKNGAVWAASNDQRVTAVGAFIRRYRIDELPQILNVLKGDMSFVGPRPERPEFVDQLSETIPYYGDRHQVKPGLTGWAQICYAYGANERDAMEKLQYDLYYIKHCSIRLDTLILIQTFEVVLFGKGVR